ncbi:MAG: hypothetical protein PF517_02385 [Salinivirgaceae bacterium]|jgi:hypothetical protein|nr:hypothetical protein [Salinivirgaceae bacterium]
MKKITLISLFVAIAFMASSQVFNTSKTLKSRAFSVGIEPMIITNGGSDIIVFGHLGYGLTKGIDISAKAGILHNANYYGGDIEFAFMKNMSFSAGAHVWGDFGLDATYLLTFDIAKNVDLYGGVDADFIVEDNPYFNFWIPIGVEVYLSKTMAFLMEASIGINDSAPHLFGGGVNIYF